MKESLNNLSETQRALRSKALSVSYQPSSTPSLHSSKQQHSFSFSSVHNSIAGSESLVSVLHPLAFNCDSLTK